MKIYVYPALIAALVAFVITPLVRALARRLGVVEVPDPRRPGAIHTLPMPLLGGLALYAAVAFPALVAPEHDSRLAALLGPGALILACGLAHHLRPLRHGMWLVVQATVAAAAVSLGLQVGLVGIWWIDALISFAWLLLAMNAVMLVNDLSGATTGIAVVGCAALFVLGIWRGDSFVALLSCLLGSACVGFLGYSLMPPSIALSRGGSAMLGLWLGGLLAVGPWRAPSSIQMTIAPLLVLALPLFNAILLARNRHAQSPRARTAPGSLTQRLLAAGLSVEQALCLQYGIGLLGAIGAALGPVLRAPLWTIWLCALLAGLWILGARLVRGGAHG
ncbi:MAG: hypothetical protein PVH68_03110 [Armatimonadota bacterium]|jgi:UDP-GlcNAc:undecaprenyl-phosphate GlcNAc-1-phosphate transferase